ncbi:oligosaccharide flippase family protein [candidate division KSB1 bacterium]|nr:oligosaccharide flippase family protein [candidate division KSB1 bacterium]
MKKSFSTSIVKLLSSKVATQMMAFITMPIITRLFSPGDFGIRQIFMSIAGAIGVVTCLRYELSIPLGKNEKEASASFTLSMLFALIISIIVLVMVPFVKDKLAYGFDAPELKRYFWILPVAVFIIGIENSLKYWGARNERFGTIAVSDFSAEFVGRTIPILWAIIIGASAAGLIVGYFTTVIISSVLLLIFMRQNLITAFRDAHLDRATLWSVAVDHKKFPIFSTWDALINTLSTQMPIIILGIYFSTTVVGHYSLGYRLISLPVVLLSSSITQVFFPAAAKEYNESRGLSNIVSNLFRRLIQIGIFPMVILGLLGAPLFGFAFGSQWIEAGVYTQILSIFLIFLFVSTPASPIVSILKYQEIGLVWNVSFVTLRLLGLIIGAKLGGPRLALIMFSAISTVAYGLLLGWMLQKSGVSLQWAAKMLLKYVSISCLLLTPACCFAYAWRNIFLLIVTLVFSIIVYLWGLYRFDYTIQNAIGSFIIEKIPEQWKKNVTLWRTSCH